jgi:hypothetical protein
MPGSLGSRSARSSAIQAAITQYGLCSSSGPVSAASRSHAETSPASANKEPPRCTMPPRDKGGRFLRRMRLAFGSGDSIAICSSESS